MFTLLTYLIKLIILVIKLDKLTQCLSFRYTICPIPCPRRLEKSKGCQLPRQPDSSISQPKLSVAGKNKAYWCLKELLAISADIHSSSYRNLTPTPKDWKSKAVSLNHQPPSSLNFPLINQVSPSHFILIV